jgi:RNA polymerase sigma-70 factor (ECF subfamily)
VTPDFRPEVLGQLSQPSSEYRGEPLGSVRAYFEEIPSLKDAASLGEGVSPREYALPIGEPEIHHRLNVSELKIQPSSSSFATEAVLISKAQAGDKTAFSLLIKPYLRLAFHIALRIMGNREDAEDTSQICLLKAYLRIAQFNGEARFSTWLTRIAINESLMKIRKRRAEERYISREIDLEVKSNPVEMARAPDDLHPEMIYSQGEKKRILAEAIETLRAGTRDVVLLQGMEERKTKETAKLLKLSESAVKSRFLRGRQQLRQCLDNRI